MNITFKKTIALLTTIITLTQIGCARIPTQQVSSLDQVQFHNDYTYLIQLKTGEHIANVSSNQMSSNKNNFFLTSKKKQETIQSEEISSIIGTSNFRKGNNIGQGALIGSVTLGTLGALFGFAIAKGLNDSLCEDGDCNASPGAYFYVAGLFGAMGLGVGAILGAGIGALIPKHEQVKIVPIVSQSKTAGTTTGGLLQVNF